MTKDKQKSSEKRGSWLGRFSNIFNHEPKNRDELRQLLRDIEKKQVLDVEALSIIEGAMQVSDMQVREIMIPRPQMVVVKATDSPQEFLPDIIKSAHSRFPVIADSSDEVVGVLLAKDLLSLILDRKLEKFNIKDVLRSATFVPESKRLNILLKDFRATRNHMAIVIDEYGGIAGLVTIEDVLEQIVGEIEDEHDIDEEDTNIKKMNDNSYVVKALTSIDDFNSYFSTDFADDEFDTVSGLVMQQFGHLPHRNETIEIEGFVFTVLNADNRRIHLLSLTKKNHLTNAA